MAETSITAEPGKQVVIITRTFDAPRELVFKTSSDPKLIPEWWGPRRFTTTVDKMEVKPGGIWRFVQKDGEGNEFAFHGVYHDIKPPERVIQTFEFEGMRGHVVMETVSFKERDSKTKMIEKSVFETVEDRDGMLKSGMAEGANETTDRLAELLQKIQKK